MVERTSAIKGRLSQLSYQDMRYLALCILHNGDAHEITGETSLARGMLAWIDAAGVLEGAL